MASSHTRATCTGGGCAVGLSPATPSATHQPGLLHLHHAQRWDSSPKRGCQCACCPTQQRCPSRPLSPSMWLVPAAAPLHQLLSATSQGGFLRAAEQMFSYTDTAAFIAGTERRRGSVSMMNARDEASPEPVSALADVECKHRLSLSRRLLSHPHSRQIPKGFPQK